MKRTVIGGLVLGCLVPVALLSAHYVLLRVDPVSVSQFRAMWYFVWPTAVFLMAGAGAAPWGELLILGVSVAGNMLIYGIAGGVLAVCWRMLSRPARPPRSMS